MDYEPRQHSSAVQHIRKKKKCSKKWYYVTGDDKQVGVETSQNR